MQCRWYSIGLYAQVTREVCIYMLDMTGDIYIYIYIYIYR